MREFSKKKMVRIDLKKKIFLGTYKANVPLYFFFSIRSLKMTQLKKGLKKSSTK